MTSRCLCLLTLLSCTAVGCMNTSQPRGRHAVSDGVVAPPPAVVEAHATVAVVPRRDQGAETVFTMGGDPPSPPAQPVVEMIPVPDSRIGRARATVLVRAPVERVKAILLDFPSYPDFLTNYQSAHVERTTPEGATIVHMKIGGLGGIIKRWMRVEISPPKTEGARLSFDAKLLEGDLKAFSARWVLDRVDEGTTKLTLESHVDPDIALPTALLDSGSAAGLKESILAVKARAEEGAP